MDLRARGAHREAFSVLQGWLDGSGDHDGIAVLPYYVRYRALVRAKVAALDLAQAAREAREDCVAAWKPRWLSQRLRCPRLRCCSCKACLGAENPTGGNASARR